ncbi:hypothetical protein [Lacrimispora sp.]|uniref:hypothetical protein n=1 Tax=Lacrimispora sp. TaxID=2719234 RepID=UPI002FD90ABA
MEKLDFRTLLASEIDCRISTVKENGISLLLYKDARVDQNILDETVGPMNWQRRHTRENANCIVSLWDTEKGQWIEKEDTGTESYTEKEKGLASDSFKRACFNWGIGRELYTAPFVWINSNNCNIKDLGNKKFTCYDAFYVSQIGYDKNRNINSLVICGSRDHKEVFSMGQKANKQEKKKADTPPAESKSQQGGTKPLDKVTAPMIASVQSLVEKYSGKGLKMEKILAMYKIKKIEDMTLENYKDCMNKLKLYEKEDPKNE